MTALADALAGVTRIGLDTAPIIYLIEEHPVYLPLVAPLFEQIDAGILTAVTSTITIAEVSVMPLRLNRPDIQSQYLDLLLHSVNFETKPIDAALAQAGAALRARYTIRLPDALQLAAALEAGCEAFFTNDAALRRATEIRVIVVSELEA
jgi:predicted nucleic acid-binding protein